VWFAVATATFGVGSWRAFATFMSVRRLAPLANDVGLRALLSQTIDGRVAVLAQPAAVDPFLEWRERRKATFATRRPIYALTCAAAVALAAAAAHRTRRLWRLLAAGPLLVAVGLDLSSYYYALFLLPALLAVVAPAFELVALAAVCASRVVNAIPFIYDNADVRYMAQSAVFLAWAATVPVLLLMKRRQT
jgi:hypothetical protein